MIFAAQFYHISYNHHIMEYFTELFFCPFWVLINIIMN